MNKHWITLGISMSMFVGSFVGAAEKTFSPQDLTAHLRTLAQQMAHQLSDPNFRNLLQNHFSQKVATTAVEERPSELKVPLVSLLDRYREEITKTSQTDASTNVQVLAEASSFLQNAQEFDQSLIEAHGIGEWTSDLLTFQLILPKNESTTTQAKTEALFSSADEWQEVWVAYPPAGDDVDKCLPTQKGSFQAPGSCKKGDPNFRPGWTSIEAFDQYGNSHQLDDKVIPNRPIAKIDVDERKNMEAGLSLFNRKIQNSKFGGLLKAVPLKGSSFTQQPEVADTAFSPPLIKPAIKLSKICMNDVKEPSWFKGTPEIYALAGSLDWSWKEMEGRPVPVSPRAFERFKKYKETSLQFCCEAGGCEPRKKPHDIHENPEVLMVWDDFMNVYPVALAFYEADFTDYNKFADAVIDAFDTIGDKLPLLDLTTAGIIVGSKVLAGLIDALPDEWLVDDDDYADRFTEIEYGKSRSEAPGQSHNVKIWIYSDTVQEPQY